MNFAITKKCFYLLFLFLCVNQIQSIGIGSDTVCSREGLASFPAADGDNEMNGFGLFETGFTLEDATTTCTFDSLFPISGTLMCNGGTLYLQKDLIFQEGADLQVIGNIYGNNHKVELSESITTIPLLGSGIILDSLLVGIRSDVSWQVSTTFQGICTINGRGKRVALESGGKFFIGSGALVTFKNMEISGLSDATFACVDDTSEIVFKNCTVELSGDIDFAKGSFLFDRNVVLTGTNQLTYSSGQTSTIGNQSKLVIDQGTIFKYAPSVANRDLLYLVNKSSQLHCNGCTLKSTSTGLRLTNGRLFLDNNVTFSSEGTSDGEFICFGNGVAINDLDVTLLSGANITVYGGLYYDNVG